MWVCGIPEGLEDHLQGRGGSRGKRMVGEGRNHLRGHLVLAPLPPSPQGCRRRTPPCRPCALAPGVPQEPDRRSRCCHWLVPSWPAPLPPPPSSLLPAISGAHAQRQTSPSPAPGVTEDSRARAPSAPPSLSPGPFGQRGRE